ncbi:MAG: FMN-binding glutamate synthase family protein, partial [Planctomycetes bacterium]|nr:FMN-binding glutamate synthase family protein [Planctomycetota bacterium]
MRKYFYLSAVIAHLLVWLAGATLWSPFYWGFAVVTPLTLLGLHDASQKKRAVLRNFPVIGHFRYLFEAIRPEMYQYFIESDTDGAPINRENRSLIYQRAKGQLDTLPFGTQWDVYAQGYEWINHSLLAHHGPSTEPRVLVGEGT